MDALGAVLRLPHANKVVRAEQRKEAHEYQEDGLFSDRGICRMPVQAIRSPFVPTQLVPEKKF